MPLSSPIAKRVQPPLSCMGRPPSILSFQFSISQFPLRILFDTARVPRAATSIQNVSGNHRLIDVRRRSLLVRFSRSFRFGMSFSALAPSRIFRASDPSPPTALTYATISSSSRTA